MIGEAATNDGFVAGTTRPNGSEDPNDSD
ncbi:MAG: hypothetical protein JWO63_2174, partial [Frankiales bacterium]|nr:hypothetical protein [Frankiales bacterium]